MPYISADELTNPILKKIAAGDESVFVDAKDNEFNIDEVNCWFCRKDQNNLNFLWA